MTSGAGSDTPLTAARGATDAARPPGVAREEATFSPAAPRLVHSGVDVAHYVSMHVLGAIFPLSAGLLLYGWRALVSMLIVGASTAPPLAPWRRVGRRGRHLRHDHALRRALLLPLPLPPQLPRRPDVSP